MEYKIVVPLDESMTLHEASMAFRREFLLRTLKTTRGNCVKAALRVGCHRNTMSRALFQSGLPSATQIREAITFKEPVVSQSPRKLGLTR